MADRSERSERRRRLPSGPSIPPLLEEPMQKRGIWKVKSSRIVYRNPWISVREDAVVRPDGQPGIFGVVSMIPGVSVIPVDDQGFVYLTREFHYGVGRVTVEAISGGIERSENRLAAAKRELNEETGLTAKRWTYLGMVDPFTTVVHSPNHMYLAQRLSNGTPNPEGTERIQVIRAPFATTVRWVINSRITHSATAVALLKAQAYLSRTPTE